MLMIAKLASDAFKKRDSSSSPTQYATKSIVMHNNTSRIKKKKKRAKLRLNKAFIHTTHFFRFPSHFPPLTLTNKAALSRRSRRDRHMSITAPRDATSPVSEAAEWRNVQYSDNISCKLMQVRTLPCWPEGGEMRTGNYRIASRREMIEIAGRAGDI